MIKEEVKIREIMIPKEDLILMESSAFVDEALKRIIRENKNRIFVYEDIGGVSTGSRKVLGLDENGGKKGQVKLVGIISKTDILDVARERKEFGKALVKLGASEHRGIDIRDNNNRNNNDSNKNHNAVSRKKLQ